MNKFAKKIQDMARVVDYQDDSIVSKEVVKKETGTISFFAFDAGQGLSEHTVPYDALVFVQDGEADVIISDETFRVSAGQMIIMPADEPHRIHAPVRFKMMLSLVK